MIKEVEITRGLDGSPGGLAKSCGLQAGGLSEGPPGGPDFKNLDK